MVATAAIVAIWILASGGWSISGFNLRPTLQRPIKSGQNFGLSVCPMS